MMVDGSGICITLFRIIEIAPTVKLLAAEALRHQRREKR